MSGLFAGIPAPKPSSSDNKASGTMGGLEIVDVKREAVEDTRGKRTVMNESDLKLLNDQPAPNVSFDSSIITSTGHGLFYLKSVLGKEFCGHAFGSSGGIPRFCLRPVEGGTNGCSVGTHAKSTKAVVAAGSWCVTTSMQGTGSRVGLALKCVHKNEIPESLWVKLDQEQHKVQEWEKIFDEGRLARKLGSEVLVEVQGGGTSGVELHTAYTPKKKPRNFGTGASSEMELEISLNSEDQGSPISQMKIKTLIEAKGLWKSDATDKSKFASVSESIYKIQDNFGIVVANCDSASFAVDDLGQKLNKLVLEASSLRRNLSKPDALMIDRGISNPFDGIRELDERITDLDAQVKLPFSEVPYSEVLTRLGEAELSIRMDRGSNVEISEVRERFGAFELQTTADLTTIRDGYLLPFHAFYKMCVEVDVPILARVGKMEREMRKVTLDAQSFGSIRYPGAGVMPTLDAGSSSLEQGSLLRKVEARLEALEHANLGLERANAELKEKLNDLQWTGGRGSDPIPARVSEATSASLTSGGLIEERLRSLESASSGSSTVRRGGFTFTGVDDCAIFLRQHVPEGSFMGYDFVSLVHRSGPEYSTGSEHLQREYQMGKGGFQSSHSAYIYLSMHQAIPEPLSGSGGSDPLPIPKLKSFALWDKGEGVTGLRHEITRKNQASVDMISSRLDAFSPRHNDGRSLFRTMLMDSQLHWQAFSSFLSDKHNSCLLQTGDAKESWLYPLEIGKGVLDELFKVRCIGAERNSVTAMDRMDEARALWGALLSHKLMDEFIASSFVGHSKLNKYSIQHLFKNRVKHKDLVTVQSSVDKVRADVKGLQTMQAKLVRKTGVV